MKGSKYRARRLDDWRLSTQINSYASCSSYNSYNICNSYNSYNICNSYNNCNSYSILEMECCETSPDNIVNKL